MIEVETVEQYEAAMNLFWFLRKLGLKKTAGAVLECDIRFGSEFNRCGNCEEPQYNCNCDNDSPNYDRYDDEASF
jgi:hypothetical protein